MNNLNKQSREYLLKESVYRRIGVIIAEAITTITKSKHPGKKPKTREVEGPGVFNSVKKRVKKGNTEDWERGGDGLGNDDESYTRIRNGVVTIVSKRNGNNSRS